MANALTWFYIIFSWLTVTVNIVLAGALLKNFLNKKTTGTLILFTSYLIIGISTIFGAILYTAEYFGIGMEFVGVNQTMGTVLPVGALLLIYVFTCRHILRDNEMVKSMHLIIISVLIGFILALYFLAIFGITQPDGFIFAEGQSPLWYQITKTDVPNTNLFSLTIISTTLVITAIQIYINTRIIVRAFMLSRRTDKIIRKRGLQMIGWGLVIYIVAGIILALELVIPWSVGSFAPTIFWTLRKTIFFASYVVLYLGWIMPDWFRRRLRGKTWFEMQYKTVTKQS